MLRKLKRKYNTWLFRKYGFDRGILFEKIPLIFKLCPLWSPSMYRSAECNQYVEWFLEGLRQTSAFRASFSSLIDQMEQNRADNHNKYEE